MQTAFPNSAQAILSVTGSVKFDITPPDESVEKGKLLNKCIGNRPVLMCASTRDGEENLILDALEGLDKRALLLLVPRHPQRFSEVAGQIQARKIRMMKRSELQNLSANTIDDDVRILLGDSMGEMFMYYAACDVAFIGGSLLKLGGQNLIEACALGKPVLIGPHTFNFEAITKDAICAGAAIRIQTASELMTEADKLFSHEALRAEMGMKAQQFAHNQHGATDRTIALLAPLLEK